MAEQATLARPYAEAVFRLAQETNEMARWSEMLAFLSQVVESSEMQAVCANPKADRSTLVALLLDIGGEHLSEHGRSLVKLLSDNRRLMQLTEIGRQFEQLKAVHEGYIKVKLVSTYAIKPAQKAQLIDSLKQRFGKEVELEVEIDRGLLGGWLIRAGDQVIDLSVRGRLQQLATDLSH